MTLLKKLSNQLLSVMLHLVFWSIMIVFYNATTKLDEVAQLDLFKVKIKLLVAFRLMNVTLMYQDSCASHY